MEANENYIKVWVVLFIYDCIGSSVHGVFSTREKAIENISHLKDLYPVIEDNPHYFLMKDKQNGCYGYSVEPFEMKLK